MSIRLSDFDIDEEEWLPNPYQAQVDAQLRQSGWPSSSSCDATPFQWQHSWQCNFFQNAAALPGSSLQGPWYPNACGSPMYCVVARPPGSDFARQQVAPILHALTAHKIDAGQKVQEHPSADGAQAYGTHMVPFPTAVSDPAPANFPFHQKLASQIFIAAYLGIRNGSPSSSCFYAVFNVARRQQYEQLSHDGEMEIMPGSEFLLCLDSPNTDIHTKVMNLTIGAIVQISYVHMKVFTGFKCEQERFVTLLTQLSPEELDLGPVLEVEGLEEDLQEVELDTDLLSEAGQLSQVSDAVDTSDTCCNSQESRFPHSESEPWGFLHEFRMSHKKSEVLGKDKPYAIADELSETGPGNTATEFETTATEGDDNGIGMTLQEQEPQDFDQTLAASGRSARKLSHLCVPKNTDLGKQFGDDTSDQQYITTLMIRNIPNSYSRSMLVDELESLGFQGQYDFLYLPIDKSTQWNVGYAFVNFMDPKIAARCTEVMTNYTCCRFEHGSDKVVQISVAYIQGLEKNLDYYSNTAVRCSRRESHRPLVLTNGPTANPLPSPRRRRRRRRNKKSRGAAHDTSPNPSDAEASSAGEGGSPENANRHVETPRTLFKARRPVNSCTTEAESLEIISDFPSPPPPLQPHLSSPVSCQPQQRLRRRKKTDNDFVFF